jgi:hypothetical protein
VRRWLIDIPALLFSLWWTAYTWLIAGLSMVAVTVAGAMLALHLFGIRWGW